jgi:hypothetical protein
MKIEVISYFKTKYTKKITATKIKKYLFHIEEKVKNKKLKFFFKLLNF